MGPDPDDEIARLASEATKRPEQDLSFEEGRDRLHRLAATIEKFRVLMALAGNPGLITCEEFVPAYRWNSASVSSRLVWLIAEGSVKCQELHPRDHFMALEPRPPSQIESILAALRRGDEALLPEDWCRLIVFEGDGRAIDRERPILQHRTYLTNSCRALQDLVPAGIASILTRSNVEWPSEDLAIVSDSFLDRIRAREMQEKASATTRSRAQQSLRREPGHQLWQLIRDFYAAAAASSHPPPVEFCITPWWFGDSKSRLPWRSKNGQGPPVTFHGWRVGGYSHEGKETTVVLSDNGEVLRLESSMGSPALTCSPSGQFVTRNWKPLKDADDQWIIVGEEQTGETFRVLLAKQSHGATANLPSQLALDQETFVQLVERFPQLTRISDRIHYLSRQAGIEL